MEQAESRLRHRMLVGQVASGRAGLGSIASTPTDLASCRGRARRQLVQQEVRAGMEEERATRAVGMRQQGAWTRWDQALDRRISWSDLWRAEPQRLKFLVQSVYDVLPTPSNLHCWGIAKAPACPLCSRPVHSSISSAAARKPWETAAIIGATTRC